MPSKHLILCPPFLFLPSIIPSIRVFSNESALRIRWPEYWSFRAQSHDLNLTHEDWDAVYRQASPGEKGFGKQKALLMLLTCSLFCYFCIKLKELLSFPLLTKFLNKVGPTKLLFLRLCCLEWPDQVGTCLQECCPLSPAQFHWVYHT